jgi:predicted DNA-binding WGR domain protein
VSFPREFVELLDGNEEWGFGFDLVEAPRLELELIDPRRNARRYYAMSVRPDPQQLLAFAGGGEGAPPATLLIVERGRLGRKPKIDVRAYTSPEQLAAKWRELLQVRGAHHYRITRQL